MKVTDLALLPASAHLLYANWWEQQSEWVLMDIKDKVSFNGEAKHHLIELEDYFLQLCIFSNYLLH